MIVWQPEPKRFHQRENRAMLMASDGKVALQAWSRHWSADGPLHGGMRAYALAHRVHFSEMGDPPVSWMPDSSFAWRSEEYNGSGGVALVLPCWILLALFAAPDLYRRLHWIIQRRALARVRGFDVLQGAPKQAPGTTHSGL